MTRVYENRGYFFRQNLSVVVLAMVFVYGIFELWQAFTSAGDPTGAMFGVLFLGGSVWGSYTLWTDGRDTVAILDADPGARRVEITLWGPFTRKRIALPLDDIIEWRFWIKTGSRGQRSYFLYVITPSNPRPLRIELKRGQAIPDGLRQIAPAAIEEFETATKSG
jgi:hypothetical protein